MGKSENTPVTVDGVEYVYEDMTDKQKAIINHIRDLDRKISSTQFNLEQMGVGREAFVSMLKSDLEESE